MYDPAPNMFLLDPLLKCNNLTQQIRKEAQQAANSSEQPLFLQNIFERLTRSENNTSLNKSNETVRQKQQRCHSSIIINNSIQVLYLKKKQNYNKKQGENLKSMGHHGSSSKRFSPFFFFSSKNKEDVRKIKSAKHM
jgi:hypothetical protein